MMTFIAIVHILVAIVLVGLVLVQDSKGNGALGMGGASSSNSVLGATGAQTLAAKVTAWTAVIFAITCLALSYLTAHSQRSVVESLPLPTAPIAAPAAAEAAPESAVPATEAAPATETPASVPAGQ